MSSSRTVSTSSLLRWFDQNPAPAKLKDSYRRSPFILLATVLPLHAFVLVLMGRFSNRLYIAYSSWYLIGTLASMQVPFVGFLPLKTSEHMAALGAWSKRLDVVLISRNLLGRRTHHLFIYNSPLLHVYPSQVSLACFSSWRLSRLCDRISRPNNSRPSSLSLLSPFLLSRLRPSSL